MEIEETEKKNSTKKASKASGKKKDAKKQPEAKIAMTGTDGVKTLDELKNDYLELYRKEGVIYQKDIMASLEKLDCSDDDIDALWDWFRENDIDVSEDADIEELSQEGIDLIEEEEEDRSADTIEQGGYATETLARIYIKQGRYDKALEIMKKLDLTKARQNIYFVDQIRFLEKLIVNSKNK